MAPKPRTLSAYCHKDMPACCRQTVVRFAAKDWYRGAGEPGDQIRCGCGNWLVYGKRVRGWLIGGWRVREEPSAASDPQSTDSTAGRGNA